MCISGAIYNLIISPQCAISMLPVTQNVSSSICRTEDLEMLETVVIVVCAVICIGAAGFAWWMENGPENGNDIKDDLNIHKEK